VGRQGEAIPKRRDVSDQQTIVKVMYTALDTSRLSALKLMQLRIRKDTRFQGQESLGRQTGQKNKIDNG
jgi:hypothetical protein